MERGMCGFSTRVRKEGKRGKVGDKSPEEPEGAKAEKHHLSSNRSRYNKVFRVSFDNFLTLVRMYSGILFLKQHKWLFNSLGCC